MTTLSVRLTLSHVAVALAGGVVTFVVVRALAPRLFDADARLGPGGGLGPPSSPTTAGPAGPGGRGAVRDAFASAVDTALLTGVVASVVTAIGLALLLSRLLLGPLDRIRAATHRIAAGDYRTAVPAPGPPELSALATDVTTLATRLRDTEELRLRLLADVAHEMRTPLTVLSGSVEGLADGVFDATPQLLTDLRAELTRLERLADDLATLSRAQEGRLTVERRPVDLTVVVDDVTRRHTPLFEQAGVRLRVRHGPRPVTCSLDEVRIGQVLANLLRNALTATPAGREVQVTTPVDGQWAVVEVTDTGIGIEAADLERVFERFYRAPAARGATGSGSGIGLTVSRALALAHGGSLRAASPGRDRGTTLTLRLPVA